MRYAFAQLERFLISGNWALKSLFVKQHRFSAFSQNPLNHGIGLFGLLWRANDGQEGDEVTCRRPLLRQRTQFPLFSAWHSFEHSVNLNEAYGSTLFKTIFLSEIWQKVLLRNLAKLPSTQLTVSGRRQFDSGCRALLRSDNWADLTERVDCPPKHSGASEVKTHLCSGLALG